MASSPLQVVNSNTNKKYLQFLIVLALPSLLAAGEKCVPGVTYLDTVTGHCDPCSDICEFTKEQGTQARCKKLCQGYKARDTPSTICPQDQYYDKNIDRCESCLSVCLHPMQGDDCQTHCPDWINRHNSSAMANNDLHNTTSENAPVMAPLRSDRTENGDEHKHFSLVHGVLIGIGMLLVCCFAGVAAILWKPCAQKIKSISEMRCRRRPHQEQDGGHPMLPSRSPIVMSGRGPFCPPTDGDVV